MTFDASASDTTYVEFDFNGDGTFTRLDETDFIEEYRYAEPGTYEPQVRDAEDNVAFCPPITVNEPPNASFTFSPDPVSPGQPIEFDASASTDIDGRIVQYRWDWDGDETFEATTTEPVVNHTYSDTGPRFVGLEVEDDDGSTDIVYREVNVVNDPPEASFIYRPQPGIAGRPIEFDASASTDPDGEIVQYNWDWDGDEIFEETTTEPTINHTYFETGFQNVILRVDDDNGGQGFTGRDVEVVDPTVVARCSVEPTTATVGESVLIDARASENVSYLNYDVNGDGEYDYFERTELTLNHTYEEPGEYVPTIEVVGPTGQRAIEECGVVTVEPENEPPEADFTYDPQPGIAGQAIEFDASASTDPDGTIESYEWDFDADGDYEETTTDPVIEHTYFEAGFENVALRVRDDRNATGFTSRDVEVVEPSLRVACTVEPATVAPGEEVTIAVEDSGNASYLDYDFDGDGEFDRFETREFVITTTYDEPGTYTPLVRVYGTGVREVFECDSVTVEEPNEPPTTAFTIDPSGPTTDADVTFDGSDSTDPDGTIVEYRWDFDGDGTIDQTTSSPTVTHSYDDANNYVPRLIVVDDDNATDETERDLAVEEPSDVISVPPWWPIPAIGGGLLGLGGLGYYLFGGGAGGGGGGSDRPKPKPKPRPHGSAQGTRYETGVFELPRSSGPISVPVGFEPDLVLFSAANGARTDTATDRTAGWTRGIAHLTDDGMANRCLTVADDAHSTDQATCAADDDLAIQIVRHEADGPPGRVTARVTRTTNDGFDVDVSVPGDDPLAGGIRVLYRAFRTGSDVDFEVGSLMTATEPGTQTVELGIDPDHLSLSTSAAVSDEDQLWTTDRGVGMSLGHAVVEPESPVEQVVAGTSAWPGSGHPTAGVADDAATLHLLYQDGDRLAGRTSARVTALDDTLRLQYDRAYNGPHKLGSTARHPISYLALAGGETMRPAVGAFSLPRSNENRTIDCGFEPAMIELTIAPAPLGEEIATGATAHPFGWSQGTAIATEDRLRQYVLHHAVVPEQPAARAGGVATDAAGRNPSQASTDGGRSTETTGDTASGITGSDTAEMDVQPQDPQQSAESVPETETGIAPAAAEHADDERAGLWLARGPDGTIVGRDELKITGVTETGFQAAVESVDTDRRGTTGPRPTVVYRAWPTVDVTGKAGERRQTDSDEKQTTGDSRSKDRTPSADQNVDSTVPSGTGINENAQSETNIDTSEMDGSTGARR